MLTFKFDYVDAAKDSVAAVFLKQHAMKRDEISKVFMTLSLLDSMIASGEVHTDTSKKAITEAREALNEIQSDKSHEMVRYKTMLKSVLSQLKGLTEPETELATVYNNFARLISTLPIDGDKSQVGEDKSHVYAGKNVTKEYRDKIIELFKKYEVSCISNKIIDDITALRPEPVSAGETRAIQKQDASYNLACQNCGTTSQPLQMIPFRNGENVVGLLTCCAECKDDLYGQRFGREVKFSAQPKAEIKPVFCPICKKYDAYGIGDHTECNSCGHTWASDGKE